MSPLRPMDTLETDRLVLRRRHEDEAAIYRQLWTERDPRVPAHRRIDADGHPTVQEIAGQLRVEHAVTGPGLLAVSRKDTHSVIGYCGLVFHGNAPGDEPELAYELLRAAHGHGYATEAARAVATWAREAGYPRLWAGVWDWNTASRRVLEKLGFHEDRVTTHDIHSGNNILTVLEFSA